MDVSEFVVAALLLELTPGPNMAYLATLSLARGRVPGLVATIGVAFGLAVHAIFAALGAAVLIQQFALIYEALRWIGVAYLLFLAWEGWQTQAETSPGRADLRRTAGPLLLRGFLSNVFNPKSILFFVSVVPRFVETESGALAIPIQMALLGCLYVGIATMVHATIVVMAVQLKPLLIDGKRRDVTRRALSVALAFVAVWLAWTRDAELGPTLLRSSNGTSGQCQVTASCPLLADFVVKVGRCDGSVGHFAKDDRL